jgi:hypothetical protein
MGAHVKIPGTLYEYILADLDRRHPVAAERVGFAYARSAQIHGETHLFVVDYEPVAEGDYIDDPTVGARINSAAIRRAMQGILDRSAACFHVHKHWGRGRPNPSLDDLEGNIPIAQSFVRMSPDRVHGMLIFSDDGANGSAWTGGRCSQVELETVAIVGFPYRFLWR